MIALKARRRVEVGPYLSFVFENRALLPGPRELSATLFIEIAERSRSSTGRDVWFELGGITVPGSFEAGHSDEEKGKLAAVHFVPFAFARPRPPSGTRRSTWWSTTPRPVRAPASPRSPGPSC